MLLNLIESYGSLIKRWTLDEFESAGPNHKIKGKILFIDGSTLFFKQIILGDSKFKYAYHWENERGELICRWDNAPHWPKVITYPHHKHINDGTGKVVVESIGGDLEEILGEISSRLISDK